MSTRTVQQATTQAAPAIAQANQGVLQRKCACGTHTMGGGQCADCAKKKSGLQRKLTIGASNDPLEQEADQIADAIVARKMAPFSASSASSERVQREDAPKKKTNVEKYKEGLEKLGEAFLKTPLGKELLEKIKQDTLVKGATELGKDFIGTLPGKIITGVAATGAVATLAATHKELPAQIPEIPLNVLMPGLSVEITYKGPVDKPTEAMITFKFTEQAPKDRADKKPMSEIDKFRAETARLAAEDANFRAGMTFKPGSPEDLQQKAEQEASRRAVLKYLGGPDIEATIIKYPGLATPEPKSGLQLTMPKPSFGIQPPSLVGDEFKLKLPGEQKKKQDEPQLQKKLSIGASNDPLEQEADRVAEQVLAAPAQSAVSGASPRIQRFTGQATEGTDTAPASVDRVLASSGRPLEPATRAFMEPRFNHDFSRVRVHTDAKAAESARAVNALAYTVGQDVVFYAGQYAPETTAGRRLMAHELTHVVQQSGSEGMRLDQSDEKRGLSPVFPLQQTTDAATSLSGGQVRINTSASWNVARQPMYPPHARGYAGEQEAGFQIYRAEDGWIIIEGPSGDAGHGVTDKGFDMVAYNTRSDQLDIVDNKAYKSSGNVGKATAIDPAKNLLKNLDSLVVRLRASQNVQARIRVLDLLGQTRAALTAGTPVPNSVHLVVTGLGGQKTGVSGPLQQRGVEFKAPVDPEVRSALSKLNEYRETLRRALDRNSGEHKIQLNLINTPSVTGFAGFWTNRLFNTDPPLIMIWNNAFGALAAAEAALARQDITRAFGNLVLAKARYLDALKKYTTWKNGIEGAGTKMQQAIGITAIAIVAVAVAPGVIASLSGAGAGSATAAGSTVAAEQLLVRISASIAQQEAAVLAAEAAGAAADAAAEASVEAQVETLLTMAL